MIIQLYNQLLNHNNNIYIYIYIHIPTYWHCYLYIHIQNRTLCDSYIMLYMIWSGTISWISTLPPTLRTRSPVTATPWAPLRPRMPSRAAVPWPNDRPFWVGKKGAGWKPQSGYPPVQTNIAGWKIPILNRKIHLQMVDFPIAMLDYRRVVYLWTRWYLWYLVISCDTCRATPRFSQGSLCLFCFFFEKNHLELPCFFVSGKKWFV